jgi:ABC-type polysaccharide/polyol phosphate export permease
MMQGGRVMTTFEISAPRLSDAEQRVQLRRAVVAGTVGTPLFFFSSALFPVPDLPRPVRLAVRLNPLSYGVDGLRGALNGGFAFGVATDFAVLGGLAAVLPAIGAWLFSKIEA